LGNIDVIVDSGTSLILANTSIANYIYGKIPGSKIFNGSWICTLLTHTVGCLRASRWLIRVQLDPCDQDVNISLTFSGTEFKVPPSTFNYGQVSPGSKNCQGGIGSIGDDFGEPLFNHYASQMVS
jgi:Eukaryotic aspartyl protease